MKTCKCLKSLQFIISTMELILSKRFIKTTLGTGGDKPSVISMLLSRLFSSNPDYDEKLHLVCYWYIEFDDMLPWREIGVDNSGQPVLSGPDTSNYGFWLDTAMTYDDFSGEPISKDEFEELWNTSSYLRDN